MSRREKILRLVREANEMRIKGKVEDAKTHVNKALELNSVLKDKEMQALILETLGFCYCDGDDYEKSIKIGNDAIAMYKKLPGQVGKLGIINGLTRLGGTYGKLGKYEKAIAYLEEAIAMSRKINNEMTLGVAYGNLGQAYVEKNEIQKGIEFCQKALEISRKTGDRYEQVRNLHNIGNAHGLLGNFMECVKNCEESARIFTEIGNQNKATISHGVLANCYSRLGKLETSQAYFELCIEKHLELNEFQQLANVYGNMGLNSYRIGLSKFLHFRDAKMSLESCIKSFKLAIEYTDKMLAGLSVDSNRTALSDKFYLWYDHLTAPFNLLGRSIAALLFLDLGRAKILRHLVYRQVKVQEEEKGFEPSWLTIENGKEKERICALSMEIQLQKSNATVLFYNFNRAEILTIWVLNANGCVSLKTSDPTSKTSTIHTEVEENINKTLNKASVGFPRDYSFFQQSTMKKDGKGIDSTDKHKSPGRRPGESCEDLANDPRSLLYRFLIDPVKRLIRGTKVIIVPQRCLFFAPFSSFIDEDGHFLSEQYEIQVIPSFHVLAISMQASRNKQIGASLFVGNPSSTLPPLPSAEAEVKHLASLLDAKPLTGRMATNSKVIELMTSASIIHIAAHGHRETGDIFLAPESNTQSNVTHHATSSSGLLTQSDVLECKLSARLVVLSCCHSGKGKLSSEGVLGIARSFLGAGASSVLITLWSIDDQFTMEFMKIFYEKIFEEKSACLALKETMNSFQRSGQYTSFLYWAAFEIMGEDVSLTKSEIEEIRRKNKRLDKFTDN